MALLRSDVLNRELIENILRKKEGTNRILVSALTVGHSELRGSLLEERLKVEVVASVKGKKNTYNWLAKVLRSEKGPANYARFQGLLETEVNFYAELLPELGQLGAPLPKTFPLLWGDYKTLNHEVLMLEDLNYKGYQVVHHEFGLDFTHVLLAVEWLARFHGLSYVLMKKFGDKAGKNDRSWIETHPWVRKEMEESSKFAPGLEEGKDDTDVTGGSTSIRARLMNMATSVLKSEASQNGGHKKLETLLERQDWLDGMRKQTLADKTGFMSLCHGQPWAGNVYFSFDSPSESERKPIPTDCVFADFEACAIGKTGYDVAHFLLTSTTREFRKNHLDNVLQIYLTELEDVISSQGAFEKDFYTMKELRQDYRKGLIMGITFCLFAMPMLNNQQHENSEEIDGKLLKTLKLTKNLATFAQDDTDSPDGSVGETLYFTSEAKQRLLDGLKEYLDLEL